MEIPLAQEIIFGLVIGSYIALGAIGFTLVYGLVNMINFAHGEFITVGAFVGYFAVVFGGLSIPVAVVVALVITAIVGWVIARVTFEPMNEAGAVPLLLMSIGLGLVLRNGFRVIAGLIVGACREMSRRTASTTGASSSRVSNCSSSA
ncbi:hypothetical protein ACFQMM_14540 [Saliphagus sp. GCM10025308]